MRNHGFHRTRRKLKDIPPGPIAPAGPMIILARPGTYPCVQYDGNTTEYEDTNIAGVQVRVAALPEGILVEIPNETAVTAEQCLEIKNSIVGQLMAGGALPFAYKNFIHQENSYFQFGFAT